MPIPTRRIAVFIEGQHLHACSRQLKLEINYRELASYFDDQGEVVRLYYYAPILGDESKERVNIRPLVDWLSYNGYTVVTKAAKIFQMAGFNTTDFQRIKVKANMTVEITVDMMELVYSGKVDTIYLVSGNGDFRALVEMAQRRGVRVNVISTLLPESNAMISDELRRQADSFIDLDDIRKQYVKIQRQDSGECLTPALKLEKTEEPDGDGELPDFVFAKKPLKK
jgi:uncharacterized LabA/DUF88 family protein